MYNVVRIDTSNTDYAGDVVLPYIFSSESRDEARDIAQRLHRAYGGNFGVTSPGQPTEYFGPEPPRRQPSRIQDYGRRRN